MPTTNQSLLDAYNALFANTPYAAMLRRRVMMGLQQNVSPSGEMPRGTAGAAESGAPGGVSPMGPTRDPTAVGTIGVNASGPIGPTGQPTAGGKTTYGLDFDWDSQTARNIEKYATPVASVLTGGLFGAGIGKLGRAVGATIGDRPVPAWPGHMMPRFFSAGSTPGFDPSSFGVQGGYAGYGGGGPDDRGFGGGVGGGGSSGGGLGGGSGAEGPDPSGWA